MMQMDTHTWFKANAMTDTTTQSRTNKKERGDVNMGLLKKQTQPKTKIEKELIQYGFEKSHGPKGEPGYVNTYSLEDGQYCLWVTVDLGGRHLYLYKEYDCGGEIFSIDYAIEQYLIDNPELFIEWMDSMITDV